MSASKEIREAAARTYPTITYPNALFQTQEEMVKAVAIQLFVVGLLKENPDLPKPATA